MQALEELRQFHEFVGRQLQTPEPTMTPEECLTAWRNLQPSDREFAESLADVQAALRDMEQGDTGVPAREYLRELRQTHGLAN
jgi:hypothetical protein